jgi:Fe-Mn family superoxide dismutase
MERILVKIDLTPLPFEVSHLEPFISVRTVLLHHGGHQAAYVKNLNGMLEGDDRSLIEVIQDSTGSIFNNAAQIWNHEFLWESLAPPGVEPSMELQEQLNATFGSIDGFLSQFTQAATAHFGSGWAWLIHDGSNLQITTTPNAELPNVSNCQPLLTIDVWEHAYYLDYQNRRPEYLEAVLRNLINWQHVENQLGLA